MDFIYILIISFFILIASLLASIRLVKRYKKDTSDKDKKSMFGDYSFSQFCVTEVIIAIIAFVILCLILLFDIGGITSMLGIFK